ncbi:unnamed protein product [Tilletia controversa]|nr:unnamed protein product [Tilletia controversa]
MSKTVEKAPRTKQDPKDKAKEKNPQDNAPGGSSRDDDAGPCVLMWDAKRRKHQLNQKDVNTLEGDNQPNDAMLDFGITYTICAASPFMPARSPGRVASQNILIEDAKDQDESFRVQTHIAHGF